jgi:tRNA nucleotidyltransferase (CCA-adding enzyme)
MNREVLKICEAVRDAGGRAMLVGGWVRDRLLGIESKDFDIEVYGIEPSGLRALLERIAPVNTVGEHFSVYKLVFYESREAFKSEISNLKPRREERYEVDVAIPRRESKSGRGHRAFTIEGDPAMTFEEATRRRDFTINAILYDPLADQFLDPTGGIGDLKGRILRAVAADTFVEDSLRVLRAVQLAARFQLVIEPQTVELCRGVDLSDLPHERVWGEIEKLLMLAARPSIGLGAALDLGVLDKLFPEIRALVGCPQESEWHPEGDVFAHTKLCLDEAVGLVTDLPREKRITVMLATLCHDLGKPLTTEIIAGRIRSLGHDVAGLEPTRAVLDRLGLHTLSGYDVRSQVLSLVAEHLRPGQFYGDRHRISDGAFRRLARRVDIALLYRVAKADSMGRGPASSSDKQDWFIKHARALGVEHGPPEPLLRGRHLIEAGFEPGPQLGKLLRRVYDLQLEGEVTSLDEAIAAARNLD